MKYFFTLFIFYCCFGTAKAQPYNNNWINYSKTYFKFRVGPFGYDIVNAPIKKGIVRINQPTIAAAGLSGTPAEQFQLWSNGIQQPIYVSKTTGIFGSSDYIEFYGEIANGTIDREFYPFPEYQINTNWSLSTDSSTYFLTTNMGSNLRLLDAPNNASSSPLAAEKNFTYTLGRYYRSAINNGFGVVDSKVLYLSSFERGEGFTSRAVRPNNCGCSTKELPQIFSSLMADTISTTCSVAMTMVGNAQNERNVKIFFNGDSIANVKMNFYSTAFPHFSNLSAARIINDQVTILTRDSCTEYNDEIRVGQIELSYKRKFNCGNASIFEFALEPSPTGRLIKMVNFNGGISPPVLYDLTNKKRYTALNTSADTLRFLTEPSMVAYQLVLARGDGTTAQNIPLLKSIQFTDFTNENNQSDYIIITNASLLGASPNDNYAEQYRAYRSSSEGGAYQAKIYMLEQLEDQFAYGVKMHPLAVKEFLRFARNNFQTVIKNVFIIGKAVSYAAYRMTGQNPLIDKLNIVPTYGFPGSDHLLASNAFSDLAAVPIGRLSAVSPQEIGIYLEKVKQYEAQQNNDADSIENKAWAKQVLLLTGANDPYLGVILDTMMNNYHRIIADTSFGGAVSQYSKTADPEGFADAVVNFANVYNRGSAWLTYFGHSSAQAIDFSLDNPNNYNNVGRYPVFLVNGCLAGNIFDYDANRLSNIATLSEKFIMAPLRGSIAYLSNSSYGVVNYLDIFTKEIYKSVAVTKYGQTMGEIIQESFDNALKTTGLNDFYGRMHAQQYTLHGDPALRFNTYALPDYTVQANNIVVENLPLSICDAFVDIKLRIFNLGKAVKDSVRCTVYRLNDTDSTILFRRRLQYISASDSLLIRIPIVPNEDAGTVNYVAIIDDNKQVTELSENNNVANFSISINPIELKPIYPYNYSIISNNKIRLCASTALLNDTSKRKYVVEIDTTSSFNSTIKRRFTTFSTGGLIVFRQMDFPLDNQVYFWRVAPDQIGKNNNWNVFSFSFKSNSPQGFEQNNFYQFTNNVLDGISVDSANRKFLMKDKSNNLYVQNAIFPTSGVEDIDFSFSVNGSLAGASACVGSSIIYHVMDAESFRVFENTTNPFGAAAACDIHRIKNFEFSTQSSATRKNAMDFMDQYIPTGAYVAVRKVYDQGNKDWAPTVWAADTALYGSRNSLYHRFKDQGLLIDSFNAPRTFIFVYKKNDQGSFSPVSIFSKGLYDAISYSGNLQARDTSGSISSVLLGPAINWNTMNWQGVDITPNNKTTVQIFGSNGKNKDSLFYTLPKNQNTQNISAINVLQWPYIKLVLRTADTVTVEPYQLKSWQVLGNAIPEGVLAPNLGMKIPSKLNFNHQVKTQYDTLKGYVVFANVSSAAFTPLKVNIQLIDTLDRVYNYVQPRTSALKARDSIRIDFNLDVRALPSGKYNFKIEVNPSRDQPEQYDFNNTIFQYINIKRPVAIVNTKYIQIQKQESIFSIRPNPFYRAIYVNGLQPSEQATLQIRNSLGQVILVKKLIGNTSINLSAIQRGYYIATLYTEHNILNWKMEKM